MATDKNKLPGSGADQILTEVPSGLKQLARLVVRGFYSLEDSLIVDMLVRYPCLREDDLVALLKFDRKLLRSRIASLKNDKYLQVKPRIETNEDGKVVKMNCYFINYKVFVNIVKYKLDLMRKKMETSERDATNRSSFKCTGCQKNFTDLEADQLFDISTGELKCTFCSSLVEEDESAGPQHDSRHMLAKFNTQMEKLYDLLHAVENVRLAAFVLDPEPYEMGINRGDGFAGGAGRNAAFDPDKAGQWSGEATRTGGLRADAPQINIEFGNDASNSVQSKKEMPIWISNSTVTDEGLQPLDGDLGGTDAPAVTSVIDKSKPGEMSLGANLADDDDDIGHDEDEITTLLLRHEKRRGEQHPLIPGNDSDSDKSDDSDMEDLATSAHSLVAGLSAKGADSEEANVGLHLQHKDEHDDDGDIPMVRVGDEEIRVTEVTEDIISRMTTEEKERYTQIFQDFYSHMYE